MDWIQQFEPTPTEYPFLQENCKKFIIGGAEIYRQYISQTAVLWLTTIRGDYDCDIFFTPLLDVGHLRESALVEEGKEYYIEKFDLT
jgi:dihydrofolate reductase